MTLEPLLELDDIQGNVLGGFNKDHQTLLYFKLENEAAFRGWLRRNLCLITNAAEVVAFNRLFKEIHSRRDEAARDGRGQVLPDDLPPPIRGNWVNIGFSYGALRRLALGADLDSGIFLDPAFRTGMADRAGDLGDPNPAGWRLGGRDNEVDVLFIVASDDPQDLGRYVDLLEQAEGVRPLEHARDDGHTLRSPDGSRRADHFGFRDAISQPGVRGVCSSTPTDFLTPRFVKENAGGQGLPGQDLVWPGEFVFGYPGEGDVQPGGYAAGPAYANGQDRFLGEASPAWTRNGSYLVLRRLKQNVGAFRSFVDAAAQALGAPPEYVEAKIVGRWPSGAPLVLTHGPNDDPKLGSDDCHNNAFGFFRTDPQGQVCPFDAHIRRAYPRDDVSQPKLGIGPQVSRAEASAREAQKHRLLRRGIPYGDALPQEEPDDGRDRGLLFMSYQTSISDQFEYVVRRMNGQLDVNAPGTGCDLLVGQNPDRRGSFGVGDKDVPEEPFVVPTGGGYFFVPSIWALKRLANPGGAWDRAPAEPNLELAYYKLGRFLYEQAPYGQDIKLTADFYNRLLGEQHRVDAEGLTKDFGLQPLNGQPGPRKFFKTPEELTQDELFQCLWWYFGGQPRRVTKAIRIPYQYRFEGRAALVNTALLVGFEGPGTG